MWKRRPPKLPKPGGFAPDLELFHNVRMGVRTTQGVTLGSTLLALALMVTLALTITSVMTANLQLTRSASNRQQALNLAESALALAIDKILEDPTYGGPTSPVLSLSLPNSPDGTGTVRFQSGPNAPTSTNNLVNPNGVVVNGRNVPPFTAHIVAQGEYRGAVHQVEAMLKVPALPALICEGQLRSDGALMVAAVETVDEVLPLVLDPSLPSLPATLASNESSDQAIVLGPDTRVNGDVQASGGIRLVDATRTTIQGELLSYSDSTPLPTVDLITYDPLGSGAPYITLDFSLGRDPVLSGRLRRTGDLNIDGDLNLDSGLLYVDGNLTVSGGLIGRGAVVVTGNATVQQASDLDAGFQVALLTGGDLTLAGRNQRSSFVQGVAYCEGAFTADGVTVVGVTVVKGNGQVNLRNANLVYLPENEHIIVAEDLTFQMNYVAGGPVPPEYIGFFTQLETLDTTVKDGAGSPPVIRPGPPAQILPALYEVKVGGLGTLPVAGPLEMNLVFFQTLAANPDLLIQALNAVPIDITMDFNTGNQERIRITPLGVVNLLAGLFWSPAPFSTTAFNAMDQQYRAAEGSVVLMDLDLSKFLRWEDRVRVALWREARL